MKNGEVQGDDLDDGDPHPPPPLPSFGVAVSVVLGMVARSALVTLQVSFLPTALGLTAVLMGVVLLTVLFFLSRDSLLHGVVEVGQPTQVVDPGEPVNR